MNGLFAFFFIYKSLSGKNDIMSFECRKGDATFNKTSEGDRPGFKYKLRKKYSKVSLKVSL